MPGLGGDNDLGLYVSRSRRRRTRRALAARVAAALVAIAVVFVLCGAGGSVAATLLFP